VIPEIQSTPLAAGTHLALSSDLDRGTTLSAHLRPAFLASGAAAENLDRLFSSGALCVTTGQQPGLFSGPLFTIYKALSAAALATRCEKALGRPVVPVFWVAGDDHDFAEVNHTYLLSTTNEVEQVELRTRSQEADATPMYRERLDDDVTKALERVAELTPDTEFRPWVMELLAKHYRPDSDMATAFAGLMADLLGVHGVVVFQPTHAAAKNAMAPSLFAALEASADLNAGVMARSRELASAGEPTPVATTEGNTLVMVEASRGRDRLLMNGTSFVTRRSQETLTMAQLRDLDPRRLSPNVLLRPVIEASIFPTVAYVAGPGERAYFPQTAPVYQTLGVAAQAVTTRWSGRVVEKRIAKVLEKYGIDPAELVGPDGQLEARLVSEGLPSGTTGALERLRAAIDAEYPTLLEAAITVDPTLRKPVEGARSAALSGVADVEKRILSRLKQQDEVLQRQLANARNALFPLRKSQERVLNVVQYLVRYGEELLHGVRTACDTWAEELGGVSGDGH